MKWWNIKQENDLDNHVAIKKKVIMEIDFKLIYMEG